MRAKNGRNTAPVVNMWCAQTEKPRAPMPGRREDERLVAEQRLAAEDGQDLADHAHRRQDHDVHGRVRVEPEDVLVEHRLAARSAVKNVPP